MIKKSPQNLRELIEQGYAFPAFLPEKNDYLLSEEGKKRRVELLKSPETEISNFQKVPVGQKIHLLELSRLESLTGYEVTLIGKEYGGKTPLLWNSLYETTGIPIRNIMVIADKRNTKEVMSALRADPKYLGGGAGAGFKEEVIQFLDEKRPRGVASVNIIVKEGYHLIGYNTDAAGLLRSLEEKLSSVNREIKGSNILVVGAGAVGTPFLEILISREVNHIYLANRTFPKAEQIANNLNQENKRSIIEPITEDLIEEKLLNGQPTPHAIVNVTDKGGDKFPALNMFYPEHQDQEENAIILLKKLIESKPTLIYGDINLFSGGLPRSLKLTQQVGISEKYIFDGRPMVVYQAVPAYKLIEDAHPIEHRNLRLPDEEVLQLFKNAANLK